ncbi:metallophosphoesterase 1 homolog [Microplitis demolitor]|uniref:metallophosphoesterase 1 homolog n=1 Tax=Microplitis demolitor TaxID=69319 RepID=UPI0004CDDA47|nr:metallophosphoesterase 1 homolog [Microplitis demolitor]
MIKRIMIRKYRANQKFIIIAIILGITIFYNDYFAYEIQKFKWATKDCNQCVKVLFVADPQIIGEVNENYFGSWFARWDSDRYLANTFSRALKHSQPDVIVFLGDLMDEGHIANLEDFTKYKNRLDKIFETPEHIMKIYLPGDNDIGGEEDHVKPRIHDRFKFAYSQPDTLTHKDVIFFKVNRLTRYMPNAPKDAFLNNYRDRNVTNVVLSHIPLLFTPGIFVKNVMKELSPQLMFTAHEHKALHLSFDSTIDQLSVVWAFPPHENQFYNFRMELNDIHEIQVPTCSYRMGTRSMGYGLAHIDTQDKSLEFTVLWLPERFPKLLGYLLVVTIIIVLVKCTLICSCCTSPNHVAYSPIPRV